jgi:hypothetical protein
MTTVRQAGYQAGIVVPPATTTSEDITLTDISARELVVVLNTTVASAGNTVQVTINGVSPSGYVYPLLVGTAVAATGATPYRIGVGLTPSANAVANDMVPRQVQIVATIAGTVSYGIDYILGS